MYKTVLFDFDGTIADTLMHNVAIANELAEKDKRKKIDNLYRLRMMTPSQFFKHLHVNFFDIFKYSRKIKNLLHDRLDSIEIFPNISGMLSTIRSRGIKLGVVTSNSDKNVRKFLALHGISVDFIQGGSSVMGKANKLKHVLKKFNLNPNETLYIGDEIRDIVACKKISLPVGVVSWGFNAPLALKAYDPEYFFHTPECILDVLS